MQDKENLPKDTFLRKRKELPEKPPFGQFFVPTQAEESEEYEEYIDEDDYIDEGFSMPFNPNMPPPLVEYEEEVEIDEDELEDYLDEGFLVDDGSFDDEGFEEVEVLDEEDAEEVLGHELMREELLEQLAQRKGESMLANEELAQIRQVRMQEARAVEAEELGKEHRRSLLETFVIGTFLLVLFSAISMGVLYWKGYIFTDEDPTLAMSVDEKDAHLYWELESSPENDLLRDFYRATANYEDLHKAQGDYMQGSVDIDGKRSTFWALKNRGANTYLKLEGLDAFSYFFPSFSLGKQLFETKIDGEGETLSPMDSELLRCIFLYDEYFYNYAFPVSDYSVDMSLEFLGKEIIDGKTYLKLSVLLPNKTMYYYFDYNTTLLSVIKYTYAGKDFELRLSDYRIFGSAFKFPRKREIYANSDLKITVNTSLINRRKEKITFPH